MSGEKFQYQCQCGQIYEATPEMIGSRMRCSACGTDLIVPSPQPAAPQAVMTPGTPKSSSAALAWGLGISAVLVVGLAVALVMVLVLKGDGDKPATQPVDNGPQAAAPAGNEQPVEAGGDQEQPTGDTSNATINTDELGPDVKKAFNAALVRGVPSIEISALLKLSKEHHFTDDEIVAYLEVLKAPAAAGEQQTTAATETPKRLEDVVKRVLPSVVTIFNEVGSGSGFVVDRRNRLIITNKHVVAGGGRIIVRIHYATGAVDVKETEVLRIHKATDLALIRITSDIDLPPELEIVDSARCDIGEEVFAIGSPGSGYREVEQGVLEQTVTTGIVSAKNRNFANHKCLQTDAAISPGNSGGPLFNKQGIVVGVNTFGLNSDRRESLNFAIYTEFVKELIAGDGASLSKDEIAAVVANPAEVAFQKGCQSLQEKQYWAAIEYFKQALEKKPDYAEAYLGVGVCYASLEQDDIAIKAYTLAIEHNADYVAAYRYRGWAYLRLKDYKSAVIDFNKARMLLPDEPIITRELAIAYNDWGVQYLNANQIDSAKIMFDLALGVEKNFHTARTNRAIVFMRAGDNVSAMTDLNVAIAAKPEYALAYLLRGRIYCAQGDYASAINDFTQAIKLEPGMNGLPAELADAYNELGVVYYNAGNFESAIQCFSAAIHYQPNIAQYFKNRADSYLRHNMPGDDRKAAADNAEAARLEAQGR